MAVDADTVVVGGGNAGLCAALAAAQAGAKVILVDWAPAHRKGGNTFYAGGTVRFAHNGRDDVLALASSADDLRDRLEIEPYSEQQFFDDMASATNFRADPDLVELIVSESRDVLDWLMRAGMQFDLAFSNHSVKVDDRIRFVGGSIVEHRDGGQGLVENLTKIVEAVGVSVEYGSRLTDVDHDTSGHVRSVTVMASGRERALRTRSAILACGGFEANPAMRAKFLGAGWDLARHRGTEFNRGDGLQVAARLGVASVGHWSGCHSVAWDANAPLVRDRAVPHGYERESYPMGIVVNRAGLRFIDEGANFYPYTYAKYGRAVIGQPDQAAFQIFDAKTVDLLQSGYRMRPMTKTSRDTIRELATAIEVDPAGLGETIRAFNDSVNEREFDPAVLDGKSTTGLQPDKSNWAQPIDTPPYFAYPVTCGVTFTFGGVSVDTDAQTLDPVGQPVPGLFAAGEMVGGIFYHNYPGGTGLVSGAVLGRRAGLAAAQRA